MSMYGSTRRFVQARRWTAKEFQESIARGLGFPVNGSENNLPVPATASEDAGCESREVAPRDAGPRTREVAISEHKNGDQCQNPNSLGGQSPPTKSSILSTVEGMVGRNPGDFSDLLNDPRFDEMGQQPWPNTPEDQG